MSVGSSASGSTMYGRTEASLSSVSVKSMSLPGGAGTPGRRAFEPNKSRRARTLFVFFLGASPIYRKPLSTSGRLGWQFGKCFLYILSPLARSPHILQNLKSINGTVISSIYSPNFACEWGFLLVFYIY